MLLMQVVAEVAQKHLVQVALVVQVVVEQVEIDQPQEALVQQEHQEQLILAVVAEVQVVVQLLQLQEQVVQE